MSALDELTIDSLSENVQSAVGSANDGSTNDDFFHLLSNNRRRYALHYLMQEGGSATKRELSRHIAAWERGIPVEEVTAEVRKPVYIALHQTHLPKMANQGIVTTENGTVTLTDEAEDLQVYLEVVEDTELPWSEFYLGLGVFGGLTVLLRVFGVQPFTVGSDLGWAMLVVVTFTCASLAHVIVERRNKLGRDGPPPELK